VSGYAVLGSLSSQVHFRSMSIDLMGPIASMGPIAAMGCSLRAEN
jgi:hypothetical protein